MVFFVRVKHFVSTSPRVVRMTTEEEVVIEVEVEGTGAEVEAEEVQEVAEDVVVSMVS
jgi:hypothetical protein